MDWLEAVDWPWMLVWCSLAGALLVLWHAWRHRVRSEAPTAAEWDAWWERQRQRDAMARRQEAEDWQRWQRGREGRR